MKTRKHEHSMSNDAKIAVLETTISHIHQTLERLDKRFDSVDRKFEKIDQRFESIDRKFDRLEREMKENTNSLRNEIITGFRDINNRLWFNFIWVVGGFIGVLTLIARLFHWF